MSELEPELVSRCLAGDADAIQSFVRTYQAMVFSVCYRMLGSYEDAEDVAQESLVRAIRALDRWDPERPLKPWLLTITSNRCRTALRSRARLPLTSDFEQGVENVDRRPSQLELGEELDLALSQLKTEYRECFVLFHQQELSCLEVSQVMGCPEGTVKTWLHRARKQLAEFLRRRGVVPEPSYELP